MILRHSYVISTRTEISVRFRVCYVNISNSAASILTADNQRRNDIINSRLMKLHHFANSAVTQAASLMTIHGYPTLRSINPSSIQQRRFIPQRSIILCDLLQIQTLIPEGINCGVAQLILDGDIKPRSSERSESPVAEYREATKETATKSRLLVLWIPIHSVSSLCDHRTDRFGPGETQKPRLQECIKRMDKFLVILQFSPF